MATPLNWDDLRLVLAIGRHHTLSAAARELGVNHSTVSRRLATIEGTLGARLFERSAQGYEPTQAGHEVLRSATRVEEEVQTLDRRVAGRDARLSGRVRLTTLDLFAERLAPCFASFAEAYPNVELEISVDVLPRNLAQGEADVALRLTRSSPPESLVGRRICRVEFALYAARNLLRGHGKEPSLASLPWMAWTERSGARLTEQWMREHVPEARIAARVDSSLVMLSAVRAGIGIAFLPCREGEADGALVRLRPPEPGFVMQLWLLTHPDLRGTARVKAFLAHLDAYLRPLAPQFEAAPLQPQ